MDGRPGSLIEAEYGKAPLNDSCLENTTGHHKSRVIDRGEKCRLLAVVHMPSHFNNHNNMLVIYDGSKISAWNYHMTKKPNYSC